MKRKLMVIEEIDCGEEFCEGCRHKGYGMHRVPFPDPYGNAPRCLRFIKRLKDNTQSQWYRLPECLEAERKFKKYLDSVCLVAGARAAGALGQEENHD